MITEVNGVSIDFHQLVEHSMNAIMLIDGEEIIYVNKTSMELFAISDLSEVIGQNVLKYLHSDYYEISKERLRRVVEDNRVVGTIEQKVTRFDGEIIDVEVTTAPHRFNGKTLAQVTIRDITEHKIALNSMIQSEKLSLIGEMAAGIVHEIRNPLTSIKGFLHLMQSGTIKINDYIAIIKSEIENIESIANELLLFSKPSQQDLKEEDIIKIVKDVVFLLNNEASKKDVTISLSTDEEDATVNANKTQLKQVFINIVKNAIEATPNYGDIKIIIKQEQQEVSVLVSDTGCGIPEDKLQKLGQSFFTTKDKGTGLGLMITHKIVKSHNGVISVSSEVDKGTTFCVTLPSVET
ncbi:PAS domain S-box protein [Aquibacillus halophilus]|uniref:histidine kinase n=1 Tax=Aquibacillus halophilus TaxID=930132 RepID=A0A6A8DQR2_9BACI|nr:ATP-binding protein [Aquibacillus halophilus]MRH43562.1 PAS domain S-box protein [Aquibacillus halophilus]